MPVLTRSMTKKVQVEAQVQVEEVEAQVQHQFVAQPEIVTYRLPSFGRAINNSWSVELTSDVSFTNVELREIMNYFTGYNTYSGLSIRNQIKVAINKYLVKPGSIVTLNGWIFKVENVQMMLENFRTRIRSWSSYPYNYILYGRTEKEIDDIITEYYDDEISWAFNELGKIQDTPHEQFKKIFPLNIKLLHAEIMFTKKIATNYRMVELIRREIDYLNEHRQHTMDRLSGEQRELILKDISHLKDQIGQLAIDNDIILSEDLACEVFRPDRIFKTLTFIKQVENEVRPNVKQVIQNNDLARYLMEFIN